MKITNVFIPTENIELPATISKPENAKVIIIFAHGFGSNRFSPWNIRIAHQLQKAGFATLLCNLISKREDNLYNLDFDLNSMAWRLESIVLWLKNRKSYELLLPVFMASSLGAAAVVKAAADLNGVIKAMVCQSGRLELTESYLCRVTSPTLLIVGELDFHLASINRKAYHKFTCPKELAIIPGATHFFEEPGKLEVIGKLAAEWFDKHASLNRDTPVYAV